MRRRDLGVTGRARLASSERHEGKNWVHHGRFGIIILTPVLPLTHPYVEKALITGLESFPNNNTRRPSGENRRVLHVLAPSRRIQYSHPVSESTYIGGSIPEAFPLFKGKARPRLDARGFARPYWTRGVKPSPRLR
jgi:hypothetical protein